MLTYKQATLDHYEGKQAILRLENGQDLRLLREEVEPAAIGTTFRIQVLPEVEAQLTQEELARVLLNQILRDASPSEENQPDPES